MAAADAPLPRGLVLRKLADRSEGTRIPAVDTTTGEKALYNPETERFEPWPYAGHSVIDAPPVARIPMSTVADGLREGWIAVEGESVVHRPGGPPGDEWRVTHTFRHLTTIIIKAVEGDYRYRVTHQPDKYVDTREPEDHKGRDAAPHGPGPEDDDPVTPEVYAAGTTRVDWYYEAELEERPGG